jgi:hypothetical protein
VSEDLGEEDIVGDVFGFEHVATDGAVGGAQVALVSRVGPGSRSGGNVLGEPRAGGGVDGLGGRRAFEVPESVEGLDSFLESARTGMG